MIEAEFVIFCMHVGYIKLIVLDDNLPVWRIFEVI